MALCLRVPMHLPHKLKYQFQCCGYMTWNTIQSMKEKAREKFSVLGLPHKSIRNLSWSGKEPKTDQDKYFDDLGEKEGGPYLKLLKCLTQDIPEPPPVWKLEAGWTRYTPECSYRVPYPYEKALVFDVEVCVKEGFYPTLAAAVSPIAWYLWVSPRLVDLCENHPQTLTLDDLIPLGCSQSPRIVVGHFISYDRARIREAYSIENDGLRYFDTLSAHTCVSGVTNLQKNHLFSSSYDQEEWRKFASRNSLEKISEFYCGVSLNKSTRDTFVSGTLEKISQDFQSLSSYCAQDVKATHRVLCKILPLFLERQPHLLSLAGILELSTPFMPVSKSWPETLQTLESSARELKEKQSALMKSCADTILPLCEGEQYRQDPWMWDQDWKLVKWRDERYPTWYRTFCLGCARSLEELDGTSIVYAGLTVPKILRLCCGPYPLNYIKHLGWGVIVPRDHFTGDVNVYLEDDMPVVPVEQITALCSQAVPAIRRAKVPTVSTIMEVTESDLYWRESLSASPPTPLHKKVHEVLISETLVFRRLLNVDGFKAVRNPLGITMSKSLTSLNSTQAEGEDFLEIRAKLSSWLSHGSRWKSQSVVWLNDSTYGVVLPMVEVCADYLRLPRERAWSSLLSQECYELGATLFHQVEAPEGFRFMEATVENLDLWLAALLSDSVEGSLGATRFSSLFAAGRLFDEMASSLKTSPEEAQCLCHAVVAGADAYVLSKLISQTHVNISQGEAYQRACQCMDLLLDYKLLSVNPRESWPDIGADEVRTPVLGARLSRPLELEKQRVRFRAQWLIHSSRVDFLHVLVACYRSEQPSSTRLAFVNVDTMRLFYLVDSFEPQGPLTGFESAFHKVQSYFLSRLGFAPDTTFYLPVKLYLKEGAGLL